MSGDGVNMAFSFPWLSVTSLFGIALVVKAAKQSPTLGCTARRFDLPGIPSFPFCFIVSLFSVVMCFLSL